MVADGADIVGGQLALAGFKMAADFADIAFLFLNGRRDNMLEVLRPMLAQRADKIRGKLRPLVEIAANFAEIALPSLRSRVLLGLDVGVIIAIGA